MWPKASELLLPTIYRSDATSGWNFWLTYVKQPGATPHKLMIQNSKGSPPHFSEAIGPPGFGFNPKTGDMTGRAEKLRQRLPILAQSTSSVPYRRSESGRQCASRGLPGCHVRDVGTHTLADAFNFSVFCFRETAELP